MEEVKKHNTGHWTELEHRRFLEALVEHGRDWMKISNSIGSRNSVQVRSHSQKFFLLLKHKFENEHEIFSDHLFYQWIKIQLNELFNQHNVQFKFNQNLFKTEEELYHMLKNVIFKSKTNKEKKTKCSCMSKKGFCECGDNCCNVETIQNKTELASTNEVQKEVNIFSLNDDDPSFSDPFHIDMNSEKELIETLNRINPNQEPSEGIFNFDYDKSYFSTYN